MSSRIVPSLNRILAALGLALAVHGSAVAASPFAAIGVEFRVALGSLDADRPETLAKCARGYWSSASGRFFCA
jgi:hypothetical protein